MQPRTLGNTTRRRVLMPLLILVAGGAIAYWASQREIHRMDEVETMVRRLCRDVSLGSSVAPVVDSAAMFIHEELNRELQSICPSPESATALDIAVTPGDVQHVGRISPRVTHTATLSTGGIPLLGLRLEHPGDREEISIIGYWIPTETAKP